MADADGRITMSTLSLNTFERDLLECNSSGVLLLALVGWAGQTVVEQGGQFSLMS